METFTKISSFSLWGDRTLTVAFSNGSGGSVDLKPYIEIGGIYELLKEDGFYSQAKLARSGRSIFWPGEDIELGADGLLEEIASRETKAA